MNDGCFNKDKSELYDKLHINETTGVISNSRWESNAKLMLDN